MAIPGSYQNPILIQTGSLMSPNCTFIGSQYYASINSKRKLPPPPGKPPGNFFEVVKSSALGQNFPAKARPTRQKKPPTPREYFRRSSQPFLLIGIEILGFCRNRTLKRIGRLSNHSLVISSSFSLSIIL